MRRKLQVTKSQQLHHSDTTDIYMVFGVNRQNETVQNSSKRNPPEFIGWNESIILVDKMSNVTFDF